MARKPTYEELVQKVRKLEKEALKHGHAVETLLESEEKLDAMLRSIGDHMRMVDKDLNIIWANETTRKIFGNDIIGKKCYEVCHRGKEPCKPYPCIGLIPFQDGKVHEHDTQIIGQNGEIIDFHCTANVALKDNEEKSIAVIVISRDITSFKRTEAAQRESEERLRTIFENSPIGINIVDKEGRPLYVNTALQQILGYSEDEFRRLNFVDYTHPEDVEYSLKSIRPLLDGKSDRFDMEKRYYRKDGILVWAHTTVSAVRDANREFQYFITMVEEITERKRAEEELQRLKNQLNEENIYLREEIQLEHKFGEIIGNSEGLRYVLFRVEQIASIDTTVLILGETGTGKELIARAIHNTSSRKKRPLIKVNCATLPVNLIESELFGHEKGAFTGATVKRIGRFELADGATLFLDEIGEMPLELQPKLLRVLQDGEFERVGSSRTIKVDVRLIAATNRDLENEIQAGRFRQALLYRLNVYSLTLPPLRERREDIPLLVDAFIKTYNKKLGKRIEHISKKTMDALSAYFWPGNVRELQNFIEKAIIVAQDKTLRVELPELQTPMLLSDLTKTLAEMERDYIQQILKLKNWRIDGPEGAAVVLDLKPSTLRFRMQKLDIKRPS